MARPPLPSSPAVMDSVEEIMRMYRSLPPRPSIEEVEAAMAVVRTADADAEGKLGELGKMERARDVPEELFYVVKEVRRNMVMLQCYEQKREAVHVVEMEKRRRAFDKLIQRASRLMDGGAVEEEKEEVKVGAWGMELGVGVGDAVLAENTSEFATDLAVNKDVTPRKLGNKKDFSRSSSAKLTSSSPFSVSGNDDSDKMSLIMVAGLIEKSVKSGTVVLDLQGKLKDDVEWLPLSLGKLSDVTELNLSENQIMALPTTIGSLKFLVKLDVHSNQLINLPDAIVELTSLVDLDLHSNRLKSLPVSIGNLSCLTNLDLSSNQLSILPESLGNLICLEKLIVETNELDELPYTIGNCTSLVEVRLDFNQLRALPEAIGKLENLEILTAHYNRISRLPTTVASLTKLKELDLSFNEVESVPESLCLVTSLVKLNVGNNFADLRSLPASIGNLEMLEELDISNNQIRILPDSFRMLSKLRTLHTEETPLEVPPREVCKLGAQAVVQYMVDLLEPKAPVSQPSQHKGLFNRLCSALCSCGNQQTEVSVSATATA